MSFLPYNLLGAFPDILMGRDPKKALLGNTAAVSAALAVPGMMQWAGMLGGPATAAPAAATPGIMPPANQGLLGTLDKFAKPIATGMQMAQSPQEPPMQAPTLLPPTASPTLAQIAQQYDPQQDMDWQRRQMRQKRIGLIGGY